MQTHMANIAAQATGVHADHPVNAAGQKGDFCSAITMARPACGRLNSASITEAEISGARPEEGSSIRQSRASTIRARPTLTIRRSPPESRPARACSRVREGGKTSNAISRRFFRSHQARGGVGTAIQMLRDRQAGEDRVALRGHGQACSDHGGCLAARTGGPGFATFGPQKTDGARLPADQ